MFERCPDDGGDDGAVYNEYIITDELYKNDDDAKVTLSCSPMGVVPRRATRLLDATGWVTGPLVGVVWQMPSSVSPSRASNCRRESDCRPKKKKKKKKKKTKKKKKSNAPRPL